MSQRDDCSLIARLVRVPKLWNTISVLVLWVFGTILPAQTAFAHGCQTKEQAELRKDEPMAQKAQTSTPVTAALSPKQTRSAQIDADTERLVQLAEELQEELAKSGKDTLSLQVVKKASEVEKLAKSLKERLKRE